MAFHLRDLFRSTDVTNGTTLKCVKTTNSTNYSLESFSGSGVTTASLRVHNRAGGRVMLGIIGSNSTARCGQFSCGEVEIAPSIACGIRNNEVLVVHEDNIIFRGTCDTTDPTDIHMTLRNGKLSFRIDNGEVVSRELAAMDWLDTYRLGASVLEEGQVVELINSTCDCFAISYTDGADNSFISMIPSRSATVSHDGRVVRCDKKGNTTLYSEETFAGNDLPVYISCRVHRRMGRSVAVGLVPKDNMDHCSGFMCGESEIKGSIGCHVREGEVLLVHDDNIFFTGNCDTKDTLDIHFTLCKGKLEFRLGTGLVSSEELAAMSFEGEYRLGVSVQEPEQVVEVFASDRSVLHMKDTFRSTDVTKNGHLLTCVSTRSSTNYSREVFSGDGTTHVELKVHKRQGNRVMLGILDATSIDECGQFTCGEQEIHGSIAVGLRDDEVIVLHKDKIVFKEACDTSDPTTLKITLKQGSLSFAVGGSDLDCSHTKNLQLNGVYRLGISLTQVGQSAEITRSTCDGIVDERATTTEKLKSKTEQSGAASSGGWLLATIFGDSTSSGTIATGTLYDKFHWTCAPSSPSVQLVENTVTASGEGAAVFTREIVAAAKHRGVVCDMCFRGATWQDPECNEVLCCNRWKCTSCDDYDLCNDCYHRYGSSHTCGKEKFKVSLGGSYWTVDLSLTAAGRPITLAAVPHGSEEPFAAGKLPEAQTFSTAHDGKVQLTLIRGHMIVVVNGKIAKHSELPTGTRFRFAVRFSAAQQAVILTASSGGVPRGAAVTVTPDIHTFKQYAKIFAGVSLEDSYAGTTGVALHADSDGTVLVTTAKHANLWIPGCCLTVQHYASHDPLCTQLNVGDRVMRNPLIWRWEDQDGPLNKGGAGTVVCAVDDDGWVRVRWDEGDVNSYPFRSDIGFHVVPYPAEGDSVVRNPMFWHHLDADAASPTGGVVVHRHPKSLEVKWTEEQKVPTKCRFDSLVQEVQLISRANSDPHPQEVGRKRRGSLSPTRPGAAKSPDVSLQWMNSLNGHIAAWASANSSGMMPRLIRFSLNYAPPIDLLRHLRAVAASSPLRDVWSGLPDLLDVATATAADFDASDANEARLTREESLAVAVFACTAVGIDAGPLNDAMAKLDNSFLRPLGPLVWHFQNALDKLPRKAGTCYLPTPNYASGTTKVVEGQVVHWRGATFLRSEPLLMTTGQLLEVDVVNGVHIPHKLRGGADFFDAVLRPGATLQVKSLKHDAAVSVIYLHQTG